MTFGQVNRFGSSDIEHAATDRDRTMSLRQSHHAAGPYQRGDARHRAAALHLVQVHPDSGQHDDVECRTMRRDDGKIRQAVIVPFDAG